jgi:P-type conjugative transfer protein TrbL
VEALLNLIAGAYLGALEQGARALAIYALPILGIAALIQFQREWWPVMLQGGSQIGDALGHLLFLVVTVGFYMWLLIHLWDLGQAAFDTFIGWGLLGAGNTVTTAQIRNPGFLLTIGLKIAFPLAEQATWWEKVVQGIGLMLNPGEWLVVVAIMVAFSALAVHHLFLLVEFYLALLCGEVLIGWGIWRTTAHFAEFSLGWLTGSLIRALVSCVVIGIAIPLFQYLRTPPTSTSPFDVLTYVQTGLPVVGAFIFAVLGWYLPSMAARMAGGFSLGLTGSTVASAAMTTLRFSQMSTGVVRGTSQLMRRAGA